MTTLGGTPEEAEVGATAAMEMFGFLGAEIDLRRTAVAEGRELPPGALSDLILAEHEGSRFADEEILMASNQFLVAGFETTATAVGNAIWLMATYPEERKKLEQDWSLLDRAIEEVLRFEPRSKARSAPRRTRSRCAVRSFRRGRRSGRSSHRRTGTSAGSPTRTHSASTGRWPRCATTSASGTAGTCVSERRWPGSS